MTKEEITKAVENLKKIRKQFNKYEFTHSIDLAIDALEGALDNAQPTGEWIESKEHFYTNESCKEWTNFYCSECDVPSISPSNFCPNCGAKMKKEADNDRPAKDG